jgi:hypothetical protein
VPEALYAYNNYTKRSSSSRRRRDREGADNAIDVDDMSDDADSDADGSEHGLDEDRTEWTACEVSHSFYFQTLKLISLRI